MKLLYHVSDYRKDIKAHMKIWTLVSYDVIHRTSSVNRKALISVQTSALINPHHGRKKKHQPVPARPVFSQGYICP